MMPSFVLAHHFIIILRGTDVILCQSLARRNMAMKNRTILTQKKREFSATRIQSAWRGYTAYDDFVHDISDIILVQSLVRRFNAIGIKIQLQEEQMLVENESATKIAATWRRFYAVREYKYGLAGEQMFMFICHIIADILLTIHFFDRHHFGSITC
jgi:hypothetical protein